MITPGLGFDGTRRFGTYGVLQQRAYAVTPRVNGASTRQTLSAISPAGSAYINAGGRIARASVSAGEPPKRPERQLALPEGLKSRTGRLCVIYSVYRVSVYRVRELSPRRPRRHHGICAGVSRHVCQNAFLENHHASIVKSAAGTFPDIHRDCRHFRYRNRPPAHLALSHVPQRHRYRTPANHRGDAKGNLEYAALRCHVRTCQEITLFLPP